MGCTSSTSVVSDDAASSNYNYDYNLTNNNVNNECSTLKTQKTLQDRLKQESKDNSFSYEEQTPSVIALDLDNMVELYREIIRRELKTIDEIPERFRKYI